MIRFLTRLILTLALAGGAAWLATQEMWFTASLCAILCCGVNVAQYVRERSHQMALRRFIANHSRDGMKERPRLGSENAATVRELERLLDDYQRKLFDEAVMQKYYEVVLDQVGIGIVSTTEDGRVLWANRTATLLVGSPSHVSGEWLAMRDGTACTMHHERHGMPQQLLVGASRMKREGYVSRLFTVRDIRHVLERQQIESWKQLSRVLTHEIMNSLSPVLSLTETLAATSDGALADPDTREEVRQALGTIHRRGHSLMRFVENYRALTRLPQPVKSEFRATALINDLSRLYPDGDVEFAPADPTLRLHADRTQLEQALINLIKNGQEACGHSQANPTDPAGQSGSPDKWKVRVSVACDPVLDEVRIVVADHGAGIVRDVQSRVFLPFFSTKSGGSGIGLSLCQQIVSQHGGHILLDSEEGRGSRFTICLPH